MVPIRRFLCSAVVLCSALVGSSFAQSGATSLGTDFWIGMMPNYTVPAQNIRIFIASSTANVVHCDFFGDSVQPVDTRTANVKANDVATFYQYATALAETRTPEQPAYRAIHVYAQNPIAVSAITSSGATTDSYLALPVHALGTDYIPSCYYDDKYQGISDPLAGEFLIVAPYDSTHVHIGPVRAPTRSDAAGTLSHAVASEWDVTLQKGQTYLVQSTGLEAGEDDLTGTPIRSDKPIAVISGHQRCSIPIGAPNDSKDHLCEMMPSVDRWGTEYYDMPMAGRTLCGDYIRLIAGEDNVNIKEGGRTVASLAHKGDFIDRQLVLDPVHYESVDGNGKASSKKFLAVQHSYTDYFNGDQGQGDPFSNVLTPREQFQTRMLFRFPSNKSSGGGYTHYLTLICDKDSITKITLNGKRVTSYAQAGMATIPGTSNPTMAAMTLKSLSGDIAYTATCGAPFAAYMYGFTDVESYGNPASMAMRVLMSDSTAPHETHNSSDCGFINVQITDPAGLSSRLSEIALITDSNDARWATPSYNYRIAFIPPFVPGDSVATLALVPIDKAEDAYAAVWASDRAGNDTVFEYRYQAPHISLSQPSIIFGQVSVDSDSCRTVTLTNTATADLTITTTALVSSDPTNPFQLQTPSSHITLHPGDSIQLQVCFHPTAVTRWRDTLRVHMACATFDIPVEGIGWEKPIEWVTENDHSGHALFRFTSSDVKGDALSAVSISAFSGTAEITDLLGRVYLSTAIDARAGEQLTLPLQNLSAGVYMVTIRAEKKSQAFKFVKE